MTELEPLVRLFGPTGAILALGIWTLRALMPVVRAYFVSQTEQLRRIADVASELRNQQVLFGQHLADIRTGIDEMQLDVARMYEIHRADQPSRARRKAPLAIEGGR